MQSHFIFCLFLFTPDFVRRVSQLLSSLTFFVFHCLQVLKSRTTYMNENEFVIWRLGGQSVLGVQKICHVFSFKTTGGYVLSFLTSTKTLFHKEEFFSCYIRSGGYVLSRPQRIFCPKRVFSSPNDILHSLHYDH